MPLYRWDVGDEKRPKRIVDGKGNEIERVLWIETETGRVCRHQTENGKLVVVPVIDEIAKIIETVALPITIEW